VRARHGAGRAAAPAGQCGPGELLTRCIEDAQHQRDHPTAIAAPAAAADDLLQLQYLHPQGEGQVYRAKVVKGKEIAKDIVHQTTKAPLGAKAMEEAGVSSRALRKIDEYHHLLVQQLRKWFKSRGVMIDEFTIKLTADEHRWIHDEYKWNELWKDFRMKNPKASPEEIMAQMRALLKQVGLEGLDIVPYPN
jgi:hypothetical protein